MKTKILSLTLLSTLAIMNAEGTDETPEQKAAREFLARRSARPTASALNPQQPNLSAPTPLASQPAPRPPLSMSASLPSSFELPPFLVSKPATSTPLPFPSVSPPSTSQMFGATSLPLSQLKLGERLTASVAPQPAPAAKPEISGNKFTPLVPPSQPRNAPQPTARPSELKPAPSVPFPFGVPTPGPSVGVSLFPSEILKATFDPQEQKIASIIKKGAKNPLEIVQAFDGLLPPKEFPGEDYVSRIRSAVEQLEAKKKESTQLAQQLATLDAKVKAKEAERVDFEKRLTAMTDERDAKRGEYAALKTKLTDVVAERDAKEAECIDLQGQLAVLLGGEKLDTAAELVRVTAELADLETQLDNKSRELVEKETERAGLQTQLDNKNRELVEKETELADFEGRLAALGTQNQALEEKLKQEKADNERTREKLRLETVESEKYKEEAEKERQAHQQLQARYLKALLPIAQNFGFATEPKDIKDIEEIFGFLNGRKISAGSSAHTFDFGEK